MAYRSRPPKNVFLIPPKITLQWYQGIYLKTNHWRWRRRQYLESVEHRCERCRQDWATEIHHLSYEQLYAEPDTDLIALCRPCHIHMHFKPANDNQLKFLFDTLDKKKSSSGSLPAVNDNVIEDEDKEAG